MNSILTKQQQLALKLIADTDLAQHFYFGGGTVLSHYYLQHRYSEDLDFFSQEEFDPQSITISIKSLQDKLKFKSFDYQNSFNRNLYCLLFKTNYVLKLIIAILLTPLIYLGHYLMKKFVLNQKSEVR